MLVPKSVILSFKVFGLQCTYVHTLLFFIVSSLSPLHLTSFPFSLIFSHPIPLPLSTSLTSTLLTPVGVPDAPRITIVEDTLSWEAPNDRGRPITGYRITAMWVPLVQLPSLIPRTSHHSAFAISVQKWRGEAWRDFMTWMSIPWHTVGKHTLWKNAIYTCILHPEQRVVHFPLWQTFRDCTLGQSLQEKSWRSFRSLPLLCLPRQTFTMR